MPWQFYVVVVIYLLLIMVPVDTRVALAIQGDNQQLIFFFVPQFLKLGLVLHVIVLALSDRRQDLVQQRLQMRIPFASAFAIVISAVIATEIGFSDQVPAYVELFGAVSFFFLTLAGTLLCMRFKAELAELADSSFIDAPNPPSEASANDKPMIANIQQLMDEQRFYANYDVTLDVMAQALNLPTHKLRPIINQQMGFKNFNQFLNSFRVAEASERLLSERNLPILSIALDCGFKSLSVFNKAFKATHEVTPSEFRQRSAG